MYWVHMIKMSTVYFMLKYTHPMRVKIIEYNLHCQKEDKQNIQQLDIRLVNKTPRGKISSQLIQSQVLGGWFAGIRES